MPIRVLNDEVASQIAAGEVVERPASVVKELIENAVDAQAGQITVQIQESGRRLIEITDDGIGIPMQELELAMARHATSKLQSAEDLFRIATLGFRGEALASIGSVSRFVITSRFREAELGGRLRVEGGRMGSVETVGGPVGTTVRVEDLFFNVPARLKFLKRDLTERQQIDALVTRYALAYPMIRFQLFQEGRPVLQTTGRGDRREILAGLYGIEIARQMLEVSFEDEFMSVTGFISPVALTRSNRKEITFFVNGRWVQDNAMTTALLQAYHTLLMVGRYPMATLFVELSSEEVDVNVHPAKAEVRFRSPDRIFSGVQRAARRALLAFSPVPPIAPNSWQNSFNSGGSRTIDPAWGMPREVPASSTSPSGSWDPSDAWNTLSPSGEGQTDPQSAQPAGEDAFHRFDGPSQHPVEGSSVLGAPVHANGQNELPTGVLPLLRLIGQVGLSYLVAEGPDGLYLIDQHAAHERVLFERFMRQRGGHIMAQTLLEPATVQLPPSSAQFLQNRLEVLGALGFEIEPFGPNTFRVRAIPTVLGNLDPQAAIRVIVEDFEEDETPLQTEVEAKIIARVCKRAAVKAGQALTLEEQKILLRDLESCRSPRTCPHGRPTMIHLSVDLLERQFGRRGGR